MLLGVHNATSSLIFLTQRCLQPPSAPGVAAPPRFEVRLGLRKGDCLAVVAVYSLTELTPRPSPQYKHVCMQVALQRRPIYQVAFRFLLFLQRMLVAPPPPPPVAASASTGGGIMASLLGTATKVSKQSSIH